MDYLRKRTARIRNNFNIHEASGSLGDLGTFLPLMISLAIAGQINLTSTLWFAGIWNIVSGLFFQVPMCVQPMKSIAAVVLASNMTMSENMAAGIGVGAFVLGLGVTRTINLVGNYVPIAVVRGIQLGTGFSLMETAYKLVKGLSWQMSAVNDQWADNFVWVFLGFLFVFSCYNTRVPTAILLFLLGVIFAFVTMYAGSKTNLPRPQIGGYYPNTVVHPSSEDFRIGFVNAGLGQIPLTLLNSVVGLCALIDDLFPDKHAGIMDISISVGIMNLVQCWFGAMPVCHGAGGLSGQYRFGARSEVSVILLGMGKLLLGILFGSSLIGVLNAFPKSILAVLLFTSSLELAYAAHAVIAGETDEEKKKEKWVVMLVTAGVLVSFGNAGIGFVAGMLAAILLALQRLGFRRWCQELVACIKAIPQNWKNQRNYATGHMLPTSTLSEESTAKHTDPMIVPSSATTSSSAHSLDDPSVPHDSRPK
ncbi:hypothetical protein DM01DRAFT_1404792 [Hesseltinella vesiculosa]|uniref:Sulfate transporter n=1 Tax=Hesseltinella vesiculosa TaxID=101127 RepID=A0A1X2GSR2_9FUNG|nr:hypothetical protein DM01DRAFT_1404792 [Hesseltinella vesiculosa]